MRIEELMNYINENLQDGTLDKNDNVYIVSAH